MNKPRDMSEVPGICFKAALLIFTTGQSLISESSVNPWFILTVLGYICTNLLFYIMKKESIRIVPSLLSIAIAALQHQDYPFLLLLLPVHLYELTSIFPAKRGAVSTLLILLPLVVMPQQLQLLYLFVAAVTLIYFIILHKNESELRARRSELALMHRELERQRIRLQENDEFMRQTEYTLKLEERNRLSQDIHDNIGHAMTSALIQMEAAKRLIKGDQDKSLQLLDNAIHISKEGIERIRSDLKRMKPPTEQMGVNRMKWFIDEFAAKHPIRTAFSYEGNMDSITPIHWRIIQENTKEALTNTLKYAEATSISIHVQVLPTLIKSTVKDNGKGHQKIIKGIGIAGMEERTAAVGGKMIIDGSRGFSVTTLLPYAP